MQGCTTWARLATLLGPLPRLHLLRDQFRLLYNPVARRLGGLCARCRLCGLAVVAIGHAGQHVVQRRRKNTGPWHGFAQRPVAAQSRETLKLGHC